MIRGGARAQRSRGRPLGRADAAPRPRLHYIVLRPSRDEALRRAQARTDPGALVDEAPVTALWDQFSDLGRWERHAIDTTAQRPDETLIAVRDAVDSERYLLPIP